MPQSPLEAAGAQVEPNSTAPLHTNEFFSGMFTNGNPLGPGGVPFLYQRFYSASRYDRLTGGSNTELSPKMTIGRRCGQSIYNSTGTINTPAKRFFQLRGFNTAGANNPLLADLGATVRDVTAGGDVQKFTKAAGAGTAAFLGVGNTCYVGDGVDLKKILYTGKSWIANTVFQQGDIILDPNGNLQVVESFLTLSIKAIQVILSGGNYYAIIFFNTFVKWALGTSITFSNLVTFPGLNGLSKVTVDPGPLGYTASNIAAVQITGLTTATIAATAEAGTATSQVGTPTGKSGGSAPAWGAGPGNQTTDNNLVWVNFGLPTYDWAPPAPANAPVISALNSNYRYWKPTTHFGSGGSPYAILDTSGNVQIAFGLNSGIQYPLWSPQQQNNIATTQDGDSFWTNYGIVGTWQAAKAYTGPWSSASPIGVILDSNGNWQYASTPGTSGGSAPVWATAIGSTTADNTITWTCLGPGNTVFTGQRQYFYAYHTITKGVSTLSPLTNLNAGGGPIVGPLGQFFVQLTVQTTANADIDAIWIFATSQGGSVPLFLEAIPNTSVGIAATFQYKDFYPDNVLNELIIGPQSNLGDPPPAGFLPAALHAGRVWGFVNGVLYYSNGPLTTVGNGFESFPASNFFQLPSVGVAAWSTAIGLIIFRVDGISIVLGQGDSNSPFYVVNIFDGVGLASRDAFSTRGNVVFMMTTTAKVLKLTTSQFVAAIQTGIGQALPEDEIGFPIGDLLSNFNSQTAFVAWYEGPSQDSGLFVADGSTGWYMMRNLSTPEQAAPWSPFATIQGGIAAIAAIQTAPGVNSLIVGTPSGPIWKRDQTVSADNGTSFIAYADIGPNVIAAPGETAIVEYFITDEQLIAGASPLTVSARFQEIAGAFSGLAQITRDPPNIPPSQSVKSQRFWADQNAMPIQICRFVTQRIQWAAEPYANTLLTNTIFGRLPSKGRK